MYLSFLRRAVCPIIGLSCPTEKEENDERRQNVQVVQQGYEAFGRGDLNALRALFDEQMEWISPGPPELPTRGRRRGRQAVAEFFQAVNDTFDLQRFEPKDVTAQGDRVVVLAEDTSRIKATVVSFHEDMDTSEVVANCV